MKKFHIFIVSVLPLLAWAQLPQSQRLNQIKKNAAEIVLQKEATQSQQTHSYHPIPSVQNGNQVLGENEYLKSLPVSVYEKIKFKEEIVSKRDAFSKTFVDEKGDYTTMISSGPVHYKKNGQFIEIDTRVRSNPSATFPLANADNVFESYFGTTSHLGVKNNTVEGEITEFLNTRMYWEVNGQVVGLRNSSDVQAINNDNQVVYPNLYGEISAEFTVLPAKRKLNYVIPDKQALGNIPAAADYLVFTEDILLPFGWTHTMDSRGIWISDSFGKAIYLYQHPYSVDATDRTEAEKNTVFELLQTGQTLSIRTKVKTDWLLSNERQFPVQVDPTVNVYPTNYVFWTWSVMEDGTNDSVPGNFGRTADGLDEQFHIRFNTDAIPMGVIVNSVTGYIYIESRQNNAPWSRQWQWYDSASPTSYDSSPLYNSATTPLSNPAQVGGTGWQSIPLNNPEGTDYTANILNTSPTEGNNRLALAVKAYGSYSNGHIFKAADHTSSNRPYLTIDYNINCSPPLNPMVTDITSNSAVFSWTAPNPSPGNGYIYYINQTGTAPATGSTVGTSVGAGVTSVTRTGLNANSIYHLWVRSNCGSVKSDWVYGGYFTTNPAHECFQADGQIRGEVTNALNIHQNSNNRVADDFIVPTGKSFTLKQITIEAVSATFVNNAVINIRKNNSGSPGAILYSYSGYPSSASRYTQFNGQNVYHITYNLPSPYNTLQSGTYWMEVTMTNTGGTDVYWRATQTGTNGAYAQISNNGGSSWSENSSNYQMMFYVAGECEDAIVCEPVTATADKFVICSGEEVTLSASSEGTGYTYTWYTDWDNESQSGTYLGTGSSITVQPESSQLYGVVAVKPGCESGDNFDLVVISVTPPPSILEVDPEEVLSCSTETTQLNVINGGTIDEHSLYEKFNPEESDINWITRTVVYGGGNPNDAAWGLMHSDQSSIASNDNSTFVIAGSIFVSPNEMESSLISPPISLLDYASPVNLNFHHVFETSTNGSNFSNGYVEISTDGANWTQLRHYNTKHGDWTNFEEENISLDDYAGEAFVLLRFRYHSKDDYFWAVDNVILSGSPIATEITWSPHDGLYMDEEKTIPYEGQHSLSVYASPTATTTYTVAAQTAVGCPVSQQIFVENADRIWTGTNSSEWEVSSNWQNGNIPDENSCVRIPQSPNPAVLGTGIAGFAKNITVEENGSFEIDNGGSLTLSGFVNNASAVENFVVKDGGNLLQTNDEAVNNGEITVEKEFTFSSDRKQYNFAISAVEGQKIKHIYPGNPTVIYHSENANYFYNAHNGDYIAGRALAVKEPSTAAVPASSINAQFKGTPFNGALNYPLSYTTDNPQSGEKHGFNLVGNPYPSTLDAIDLYQYNWDKMTPTFLFWDNRGNTIYEQQGSDYQQSNYASFNAAAGTNGTGTAAIGASGTLRIPSRHITVGTGFMIQAKPDANGQTLDFKNEFRSNNNGVNFNGKPGTKTPKDNRYWLTLTTPAGLDAMTAVVYFDGGNDLFAEDDTENSGSSDELYTFAGETASIIQGKSSFHDDDAILLGYNAFETGTYIISLHQVEGVFEQGQNIYLIDRLTGITTKLNERVYKFVTRAGEHPNRFTIVYKQNKIGNNSVEDTIFANKVDISKRDGKIRIYSSMDKITDVEVFGIDGSSIYKSSDVNSNEHSINSLESRQQILIIGVKTETGEYVNKKFVNK